MKNLIMCFALFACVACSVQDKDVKAGDNAEEALSVSSLNIKASPYNFSSIENLRTSILHQADVEGLDKDAVVEAIDNLSEMLIDANMQDLSKCETEAEADEAMMKLFMNAFGAKSLHEILKIDLRK